MQVWDPQGAVAFWINQASRLLLRRHESRLRPLGFAMSHLPVLVALEEGGPLSQKELAQRARVEQPSMAEALVRMERDGVIERAPNPDDRRATLISLTRKARARVPKAKEALTLGEHEATAGLTKEEKVLLLELLRRVVANLEKE